jgi:hypothetical protein
MGKIVASAGTVNERLTLQLEVSPFVVVKR